MSSSTERSRLSAERKAKGVTLATIEVPAAWRAELAGMGYLAEAEEGREAVADALTAYLADVFSGEPVEEAEPMPAPQLAASIAAPPNLSAEDVDAIAEAIAQRLGASSGKVELRPHPDGGMREHHEYPKMVHGQLVENQFEERRVRLSGPAVSESIPSRPSPGDIERSAAQIDETIRQQERERSAFQDADVRAARGTA